MLSDSFLAPIKDPVNFLRKKNNWNHWFWKLNLAKCEILSKILDFPISPGGGLGVSDTLKVGFERKHPGFSVFRFHSDNPEIFSRFH